MECTQRLELECTQDLQGSHVERLIPEQIGILGISGKTYPIKKGPNKVGRDPQTCGIVLNMNSISRQHAVINILNKREFMLMDLESANKTKLEGKTLSPYMPQPLHNGDTVQFGDVFGVFRLLEEENELPMTQALDIPDTPVFTKHHSRLRCGPTTMIPESPDVSDKEESYILESQRDKHQFKSPSNHYIKSSGKTIAIQPIGSSKIDNVYWTSSKKSISLNSSTSSLNKSNHSNSSCYITADNSDEKEKGIHVLETLVLSNKVRDSIDSIHSADTQIPAEFQASIHNMNTQLPIITEKLTNHDQLTVSEEMENIFTAETQLFEEPKDPNIYFAETQPFILESKQHNNSDQKLLVSKNDTVLSMPNESSNSRDLRIANEEQLNEMPLCKATMETRNRSNDVDDEILFDELDSQSFQEDTDSQCLLTPSMSCTLSKNIASDCNTRDDINLNLVKESKQCSTELNICNDFKIFSPPKIIENLDDDVTDCEDSEDDLLPVNQVAFNHNSGNTGNDFDDMCTQIIEEPVISNVIDENKNNENDDSQEKATQILEDIETNDFDEALTQIIVDETPSTDKCTSANKVIDKLSPFKLPTSALKAKKKVNAKYRSIVPISTEKGNASNDLDDMCTQIIEEPVVSNIIDDNKNNENYDSQQKATQILEDVDCSPNTNNFEEALTQIIVDETPSSDECTSVNKVIDKLSPFKLPTSTLKAKKKVNAKCMSTVQISTDNEITKQVARHLVDNENYYADTQEIRDDLCSQKEDVKKKPIVSERESINKVTEKVSPFKLPISTLKAKKKNYSKHMSTNQTSKENHIMKQPTIDLIDDEKYYAATQEIFDDLCSQKEVVLNNLSKNRIMDNDEIVPCSLEEEETPGERFPYLDNLSPRKHALNKSCSSSDTDDKVNKYVFKLTSSQIKDVIGASSEAAIPKQISSDSSDVEHTPKKIISSKLLLVELPDSVEIKKCLSITEKPEFTDSSTDSEPGTYSGKSTPILYGPKKRNTKVNAKLNLMKKFDVEALPTRVLTRQRKPTSKVVDSEESTKLITIFKSKILPQQEHLIVNEIIPENIYRLRNKSNKTKSKETSKSKAETPVNLKNKSIFKDTKKTNEKVVEKETTKKIERVSPPKDVRRGKRKKETNTKEQQKAIILEPENEHLNTDTRRSSRSRRYQDKKEENKSSTNKMKSPEKSKIKSTKKTEQEDEKKNYKRHAQEDEKMNHKRHAQDELLEKEIRRSRRQRTIKDYCSTEKVVESRKRKKDTAHEKSTVYNISSDTNAESPKVLKRPANHDLSGPSSKRSKSGNSSITLRSTPARGLKAQRVLFTGFSLEAMNEIKLKLEKMGAVAVTDVKECTVLVTMEIKRTVKFLCAVGLGIPIVGPNYVQACVDTNMIVDPWLYVIKDDAAEKRFKFSIKCTLTGRRNFLLGYHVSATPNVRPSPPEMKLIVECSGGTWGESDSQWVCVSCSADKSLWSSLVRRGASVVSSEFILAGALKQQVDVNSYKLI